ncbi:MAG: hypothetical protein JXR96_15140, partial [Deltaproteobacteria bacterium]|nr:hypothetical protein [Deltaproteobacteria bacterium]
MATADPSYPTCARSGPRPACWREAGSEAGPWRTGPMLWKMKARRHIVCSIAMLMLLAACSAGQGDEAGKVGEACVAGACVEEAICRDGICRAVCEDDQDCKSASEHCRDGACVPVDLPICSNERIEAGETCDDGDLEPLDGCDADCQIEAGWYCTGEPSSCETDCGDGIVAGDEECDGGEDCTDDCELASVYHPALVQYWPLDDSAGTLTHDVFADLVGHLQSGTSQSLGEMRWAPDGVAGVALGFHETGSLEDVGARDDNLEIPTDGLRTSAGTVALWVRLFEASPYRPKTVFGHASAGWQDRLQIFSDPRQGPAAPDGTRIGVGVGDTRIPDTGVDLTPGAWQHLALSWDDPDEDGAGELVLFVDGIAVFTESYTGLGSIGPLAQIGNDGNPTDGGTTAFYGLIDEVRIFDQALTELEIETLYLEHRPNRSPSVDAGADQVIDWPDNVVALAGSVSDDGLPDPPAALTLAWSEQSGPGEVVFSPADQASSNASLSAPGVYVLELSAFDGELSGADTLRIEVREQVSGDYYASPDGAGDGLSPEAPFRIADFWDVAQPGDVLVLLDGVYTGDESMITPPQSLSGTSGAPITIKAAHDGQVLIDGEHARQPLYFKYSSHFIIEGINACCSNSDVIEFEYATEFNVIRRVVAWDADPNSNSVVFGCSGMEGNVFEDVAGWGTGRKILGLGGQAYRTVFRRAFFRWSGFNTTEWKLGATFTYYSEETLMENCIGTWDTFGPSDDSQTVAIYGVDQGHNSTLGGHRVLGCIGYHLASQSGPGPDNIFSSFTLVPSYEIRDFVAYSEEHDLFSMDLQSEDGFYGSQITSIGGSFGIRSIGANGGLTHSIAMNATQGVVTLAIRDSHLLATSGKYRRRGLAVGMD